MTENTVKKTDKPWQFQKGQSGNPKGKPKGVKHKATQVASLLIEGEMEALTRKAVELALQGDTTALKICLDRIAPPLKSTMPSIQLDLSHCDTLSSTAKAFIDAASTGKIPPDIATQLIASISNIARVEEIESLKHRLEAIEHVLKRQS